MASIAERVKQIIVEQLGVDEAQVEDNASFVDDLGADSLDIVELVMAFFEGHDQLNASFVDDLGADSLDIVELVMAFEEAFELEIPDEDAEKIATVKDAVSYIENKSAKK